MSDRSFGLTLRFGHALNPRCSAQPHNSRLREAAFGPRPVHDPVDIGKASLALGIFRRAFTAVGFFGCCNLLNDGRSTVCQKIAFYVFSSIFMAITHIFFGIL